jgi:hypothetical protein
MTGQQIALLAFVIFVALCKAYSMGRKEGMKVVIRLVREDMLRSPGLVSAKGIADQMDQALDVLEGKKP